MSLYQKRFSKFLREQDDENTELTDQEAMATTLDPDTSVDDFDVDVPEDSPVSSQSKEMFEELNSWIQKMDEFRKIK